MPPSFILALLALGIAAIAFVAWRKFTKKVKATDRPSETLLNNQLAGKAFFWVFLVLSGLLVVNASANMVPSQHSGIVTQFKAATGDETGSGLVFVAPWQKVSSWDASRQTWDHLNEKTCVTVRIVGSQSACVEVKIEWQIVKKKAPDQWAAYKDHSFPVFADRRVHPNLTDSVNEAYETHDPLSNVDKVTGAINPPPKAPFVERIRQAVISRIGSDILTTKDGLRINIGFIHYNQEVQRQIEEYSKKVLELRVLEQEKINADARKAITDKNQQRDLRAWCLEIAQQHGKEPGFCLSGATPTPVTVTNQK